MAGTNTAKKTNKKKIATLIIVLLAIIGIFFMAKKFFTENEAGTERRKQENAKAENAREIANEQSHYGIPLKTSADLDDTRRYGYDVLYAHHGVRILLEESKIYIDEPELTFNIINDSDEEFNIGVQYCAVNGLTYHPDFDCKVPAGEKVQEKMVLDSEKMKEIKVSKIRLCFLVCNNDFSIYESSKAVKIDYDNLPIDTWNAASNTVTVYEDSVYIINASAFEKSKTSSGFRCTASIITRNDNSEDMELYMNGYKLFDKNGRELSEDGYSASFYSVLPGNALSSSTLTLKINSDKIAPEDIDELMVIAALVPRGTKDYSDAETISFRVPYKEQ